MEKNQFNLPELKEKENIFGKWAGFFIDRYRIVFLIITAILIWGVSTYLQMPRELSPEIVLPFGHVITTYTGAGPDEMETLVTNKIEKKMDELENVKKISSVSGYGYSSVFVEFEQGVEVDDMIQKMRDKISSIQHELPKDAENPQVMGIETNNSPVMIINVSGDYDFATLKTLSEKIENEIEKSSDISDVQLIGGLEREIKIIVNPQKLYTYNLSLDEIKNALVASNINFPGGNVILDNKNYNIRTVGELTNATELGNTVIKYIGNNPLFLRDIATIEDGYADAKSYSRMSNNIGTDNAGMKKSIALSVKKKEVADVIKVSKRIHELIQLGKGSLYPEDLTVEISGDTAIYVEDQLGTVVQNSKSGLILVIIVLFLFIGLRESLVVSAVIPLSIFISFGFMSIADMTFNTITLFSLILAVGMLVDNGIVIMENIDRLRNKGLTAKVAAKVGTNQIAPAVASSTLTTLSAFFPIMLTPGIMGKFIRPIPLTVIFALSASFIVAITITPALCSILLKESHSKGKVKKSTIKDMFKKIASILVVCLLSIFAFMDNGKAGTLSIVFAIIFTTSMIFKQFSKRKENKNHFIIDKYGNILYSIISSKWKRVLVLVIVFVAFVGSIALIPLNILKVEMFGQTDYTRLYVNVETPLGTNLDTTSNVVEYVEEKLLKYKEIKSFVSNIGITGADSLDEIQVSTSSTPNKARIVIELFDEKDRDKTSMELASIFRQDLADIPGAKIQVQELENGPPSSSPVLIRIKSENYDALEVVSDDFVNILKSIEGTRDVENSLEAGSPELQIKVNKEKASYLGLNDMAVAAQIRNATYGLKATTLKYNRDEIDVIIRTNKENLNTKKDLEKIYFMSQFGNVVPFSQVAEVVETNSVTAINHDNLKRQVSVSSDVETNVIPRDIIESFKEAISDYDLPDNMIVEYGGEEEEIQENFASMFNNMAIAAILVFIILAVQFNSLSQPFIILTSVPMALIGVMPGLVVTGNTFGFVSFVGLVALVGIAVNDAIVLIDYNNYLRKNGYSLKDAVRETGITRFMPVLATSITTIGGILPITIKQAFFAPMGYTIIFGLCMTTVLTLVVIPVSYTMLEEWKLKRKRKKDMRKGDLKNEKINNPVASN
jgi:HAE1 family hydrophobic/amphiphilic exporter-1